MTERTRITTCCLMRILVQSISTLCLPTPAAQNMIYVIIQSQTVMRITDINSVYGTHTYFPEILGMCYGTDMRKAYIFFQVLINLCEVTIEHYRPNNTNFGICRYWELDLHHNALICPEMINGVFPETLRKIYPILILDTVRNTSKYFYYLEDNSSTERRFLLTFLIHKRLIL